jgi:hypothetical protein
MNSLMMPHPSVVRSVCTKGPESYAGGSVATGRAYRSEGTFQTKSATLALKVGWF